MPGGRGPPAPGTAPAAPLVTTYEYEPVFNQPLTVTGPGGHTTVFTYDYQEGDAGDLTAAGPAGGPAGLRRPGPAPASPSRGRPGSGWWWRSPARPARAS